MYGTVARMKVKAGEVEQLQKTMQDWDAQGSSVEGAVATYIYQTDKMKDPIIKPRVAVPLKGNAAA